MNNNILYKLVNQSIDGLDVAFKGTMPTRVLEALEQAKVQAQAAREAQLCEVVPGLYVDVQETGAIGGYAYRFDTGPDGETWFIKKSEKEDWNVRVSCKSAMLAARGWQGAQKYIMAFLKALGFVVVEESIGRVDVAHDLIAPEGFNIDPRLMVAHAQSKVAGYADKYAFAPDELLGPLFCWKNHQVQSLTIGKMPGRQVIIYDKSAEVKAKGKAYWWQVWRLPENTQVWRVEVRAGKKFLKEKLGVSKWDEVAEILPTLVYQTLEKIRMTDPTKQGQKIVTRRGLHPFWDALLESIRNTYAGLLKPCLPLRVVREERQKMADILDQQVRGLVISYAAVCDVSQRNLGRFTSALMHRIHRMKRDERNMFNKKWQKSQDKYAYLRGQLGGQTAAWATA